MSIFLKMVLKGMKRRKREMRYVSLVTFMAVLFLSSVTLFQNIMDRYLMETNYQNYGDWVISAVKDYQDPGVIFSEISHPYLAASGVCQTGEMLLDENDEPSGVSLGTIDDSVREFGNISLYEGRFPETQDEIAMDLSSLSVLGYSYDLGQKIRVAVQTEEEIFEKEFQLVGTMESFAENWKHLGAYFLPNGIVTEEGMRTVCEPLYATYFYQLDRAYEDIDAEEFTAAFMQPGFMRVYNSYVYENRIWGSRDTFRAVEFLLVFLGALAVGYLMMSYVSQRRKWYYQLRCTGADRMQIRMMILIEAVYGTFPWALSAMVLPYLAGAVICYVVSVNVKLPYFFVLHPEGFFRQLGAVLGVILFSVLCAWAGSRDKNLGRNKEEVTKRQVKRLRRDARKERNVGKIFLRRQRKLHPFQRMASAVFSAAVCMMLILCLTMMYQAKNAYEETKQWYGHDFSARKQKEIEVIVNRNAFDGQEAYVSGDRPGRDMYYGVSEEAEKEIESLIGIAHMERQIQDVTHILQWEGKKDSPVEKLKKEAFEHNQVNVPPTWFHYYEDYGSIREDFKKKYKSELKSLDEKAFQEGEEIILVLFDYESSLTGEVVRETTVHPGDTVEIVGADRELNVPSEWVGYHLPGCTPVKVGAVIENPDVDETAFFGYFSTYGIVASKKLAERVAKADGKKLYDNQIEIDLNRNQSFESTQKRLASIFKKNDIEYASYVEEIKEAWNAYVRKLCAYGITFSAILFLFLLLQVHFYQIQNQYRERKYRLLKQLGMEHSFFRRMAVKEGLGQAVWMLLGIPCGYGVLWQMFYMGNVKKWNEGITVWSEALQEFTSDPYWATVEQIYQDTSMSYILGCVGLLMLGVVLISYLSARKYEKGQRL